MPRPPHAEYSTAERAFERNHPYFHQQKTRFLLMKMKFDLSGWLSVMPCCIQREADEITTLLIAVFALKHTNLFSINYDEPSFLTLTFNF
jgi:hypothetical protein